MTTDKIDTFLETFNNNFRNLVGELLLDKEHELINRVTKGLREAVKIEPSRSMMPIPIREDTALIEEAGVLDNLEESVIEHLRRYPNIGARELRTGLKVGPEHGKFFSNTLQEMIESNKLKAIHKKGHLRTYILKAKIPAKKQSKSSLTEFQEKVVTYVKTHPGKKCEKIAQAMCYRKGTKAMNYHLSKLTKDGLIVRTRVDRGNAFLYS